MTSIERSRSTDGASGTDRAFANISRRRFIEGLLASGAAVAGGFAISGCTGGDESFASTADGSGSLGATSVEPAGRLVPGAIGDRVLVVVDLQGGNDGLSTLVPYGSGAYYDLRPTLAIPEDEVIALDDEVGLHPSLERLAVRGITTVEGVGPIDGDLSHFAMTARWQRGDVDGSESGLRTGFLGRLVDALDDGSPLVGLSMGSPTAHLTNGRASTIALESPDELWFLQPADWAEATVYQQRLAAFGSAGGSVDPPGGLVAYASDSYEQLLDLGTRIPEQDDIDWDDPMIADGGDLGWRLYAAAELLASDVGTRVVYVATDDYDTHSEHMYTQADNLSSVDAAIDGFLEKIGEAKMADNVAVATISEFGRRVPENDNGLDHGAASTMLIAGPVGDIRAGERPPLDDLDDDDNLRTTIGFDRYLASLAEEWLGVEAASVLPGEPEPLGLFA